MFYTSCWTSLIGVASYFLAHTDSHGQLVGMWYKIKQVLALT